MSDSLGWGRNPFEQQQLAMNRRAPSTAFDVYTHELARLERQRVEQEIMRQVQGLRDSYDPLRGDCDPPSRLTTPSRLGNGKKPKPDIDAMGAMDYLRARNAEWLEGVEV